MRWRGKSTKRGNSGAGGAGADGVAGAGNGWAALGGFARRNRGGDYAYGCEGEAAAMVSGGEMTGGGVVA
jgi:hypothetical protein